MHLVENIDDVEKLNINGDAALLAQTTLAISEWEPIMMSSKNKFENLYMPRKSDLCYATTNRQSAILDVLPNVDSVLVVGSENSSNTNALVKMVESKDVKAYRIEDPEDLKKIKIDGNVALTAGASAPDYLVFNIINALNPKQIVDFEHKNEDEYFPLPKELRNNVKLIASFLELFNQSEIIPEKNNGISNDKNWSATEALSSL
jgi:4-hydroxy-3-methylbut-2-enyl diphosphate reductase